MSVAFNELWAVEMLIAAAAGGALGAALGALPAFIFCGFMVIGGQVAEYLDPNSAAITSAVAFGPVFSPAISFAAGAAAAAYAADRGYMDFGFDYHEGKNIAAALGTRPDVLAVGAVFGILGYWIQVLSATLALPWDPIAMGVVLSALVHRVAFGYPLIGKVRGKGLLDMGPFDREEMRVVGEPAADASSDDEVVADGGTAKQRLAVEPWLPHQYKWSHVATIGAVGGVLGAFIWSATGLPFLAFGISAASLVFLNCGVEKIPVTHHITIVGSAAAWAFAVDASQAGALALVIGGIFGVVAALFAELFQRVFYAHGDTHWDPPAAAIVFGTFLIGVMYLLNVFQGSAYVPIPGA